MTDSLFRILLVILLIAINGFFAGAEVALLSVRHSRLRQMAEEGVAGAQAALNLLSNPGRLLSVTQVGVTLASLGLGWAGEDTLFRVLTGFLQPVISPLTAKLLHGFCFALAFLVISYFHVVLGEVVPKNLAIAKADRLAALVAPALLVFYRLSAPFVVTIDRSAAALTRALRLRGSSHAGGHSAEELKLIVSSSRGLGYLPEAQEDMIHRVLDLDDLYVREIMKPRREIVSVSVGASLDDVLKTMVESQHSRLPVWEEKPEQIIGAVFFKDMLRVWHERRILLRTGRTAAPFHLTHIMRKPLIVPETKPLMQMLEEFRQRHSHMAMVVDEFGTVTGLLTVEDVLEQIVGEIEDEFDEKLPAPHAEAHRKNLDGATSILDLASIHGIELPANGGFETIAGYMLFKLGHIPQAGESVQFDGRRFTVTAMDRNRIATVRIDAAPAAGTTPIVGAGKTGDQPGGPQVAGH